MPKFHDPAPYDIDEHTGYKQIFDGKSFTGWDADPTIWRIENGVMVGETLEASQRATITSSIAATNPRLRSEAADEDRKRRRRRHSVPQCYGRALDPAAARRPAAL